MLSYDDKKINKGQAVRIHTDREFGYLAKSNKPFSNEMEHQIIKIDKSYEVCSTISTLDIYYNDKLLKKEVCRYNDYYGFYNSLTGDIQEVIDKMVVDYDLVNDEKFDIRVSVNFVRDFYIENDGKLSKLDDKWYFNASDSKKYFEAEGVDKNWDSEFIKSLDISRPCKEWKEMVVIYSSLRDGFKIKDELVRSLINEKLSEGFTIQE